jgi:uncharacterized protein YpmS
MDFELLHQTLSSALEPLREQLREFVLENKLLALVALCVVPTALVVLSHKTEQDLEEAQRRRRRATTTVTDKKKKIN